MGKKCAYCDRTDVKITKEHVVNKALIDEFFKIGEGYANCFDDYTKNYLTSKDVCKKCNNVKLGQLDEYFLDFLRIHLPTQLIKSNSELNLTYNYDKLSKWLLKTLYNSERKTKYDFLPKKLKNFRQYILGNDNRIKLFRIYFELLQDVPIEEIKKHEQYKNIEVPKLSFLRLGNEIPLDEYNKREIKTIIKHITISNFVFHIFILTPGYHTTTEFNKILNKFKDSIEKMKIYHVDPKLSELKVKPSNRTIIDILEITYEGDKTFAERKKDLSNKDLSGVSDI